MHKRSDLYRAIWEQRSHYKEVKCLIAGVEQTLVSASISGSLFDGPSIGNAVVRRLDLEIYPNGTIPRTAKIELFVRLSSRDGTQKSEWIPKGVFFINERHEDKETGVLSISAMDVLAFLDQYMVDPEDDFTPEGEGRTVPATTVMSWIANKIGAEIDPRTVLYPYGTRQPRAGTTMRQVAQYIAAMHGGNWMATDEGKLLLAPIYRGIEPQSVNVLSSGSESAILFGDVVIYD